MSEEESSPAASIARISVKVPPFWRANPEIWFSQMESQFPEELGIVGDIILNPPAVKPYAALRTRLCLQYAETEEQRLRGLISGMQLGDRTPSPFADSRTADFGHFKQPTRQTGRNGGWNHGSCRLCFFDSRDRRREPSPENHADGDFVTPVSLGDPRTIKLTWASRTFPSPITHRVAAQW
ncbi:retrovirus-related Pol polyprotein from transposon 297 [Trichonephila inaurata madagascariensis]|uniref:Retrovirus-related Pol polyprotein from transposon 297 n=1 Tax=Trichonephila inaurata madagascariensis TaxID=2747483 RepID=A0A8X6XA92_9ARAC|nr:retrovirus-related Pol polyprotein from transposon 297 [Trichonephila inaurata madagascariensis]